MLSLSMRASRQWLVLLLFVSIASGCDNRPPQTSIKLLKEKYDKITNGMDGSEIEALLGGPGGPATDKFFMTAKKDVEVPGNASWQKWKFPQAPGMCFIGVAFVEGKVVGKTQFGLQ
jgi:hypothetical protein